MWISASVCPMCWQMGHAGHRKQSGSECIYSGNLELEVRVYDLADQTTEQENSCINELQRSSTYKIR